MQLFHVAGPRKSTSFCVCCCCERTQLEARTTFDRVFCLVSSPNPRISRSLSFSPFSRLVQVRLWDCRQRERDVGVAAAADGVVAPVQVFDADRERDHRRPDGPTAPVPQAQAMAPQQSVLPQPAVPDKATRHREVLENLISHPQPPGSHPSQRPGR